MPALDFSKNQPQRHHLWPLCWNSRPTTPHPPSSPPHQPLLSHLTSAFTSVQPWECFRPSLLQAICAQYNLHLEPYQTPFTPLANYLSLSTPSQHMYYCPWVTQSAVCLVVCVTEERVWNVPLVASVMCVLLMELVEDAPRHWSQTSCMLS